MEQLGRNPYPGRGIVMGLNEKGDQAIQVYWIMGRSENSRNRIFVEENGVVRTQAFDATKVEDPRLIIYTVMRKVEGIHLVSNGDQTDSIAQALENRWTFEEAVGVRDYEPDAPNFTPRITGAYSHDTENPFALSIIRRTSMKVQTPPSVRILQTYVPENGIGRCVHTYQGDGKPLPSFDGSFYPVLLKGSVDEIASTYWALLNPENKVALVAKGIHRTTGETEFSIINRYK